jgi:glycosyltransferase involved in cell wall biosynthesis
LKVLHIAELVKGGVATILNEVIQSQNKIDGVEAQVLVNKIHVEYITSNCVNTYSGGRSLWGLLLFANAILKLYLKERPDVIHLHSSFAGLVGRLVLLPMRVKIIYQPHGVSFDIQRVAWFKRLILGCVEKVLSYRSAKIIAISSYEFKQLECFISTKKLVLINNGVVDIEYKVDNHRNGRLLFVGRFDRQKGLDLLLNYYRNNDVIYPLDIVGDSVLSNNDQDTEALLNVELLGWKTSADLAAIYSQYSAVVMPSRWEGFGLVAIEALRSGTPVICSDRGALPFIIKNGMNGFVFDLDNINDALNSTLLIFNSSDIQQLIDNSRNTYLSEYTSKIMCDKIVSTYY